ncbi:Uncharacterised protein [Mycobacteroides abscessus subsp. abscessus]|nr:Uncharacterised protein [Mycobacteroides abscessus subsp. abscessus]
MEASRAVVVSMPPAIMALQTAMISLSLIFSPSISSCTRKLIRSSRGSARRLGMVSITSLISIANPSSTFLYSGVPEGV